MNADLILKRSELLRKLEAAVMGYPKVVVMDALLTAALIFVDDTFGSGGQRIVGHLQDACDALDDNSTGNA
jgi:hypothetical protein